MQAGVPHPTLEQLKTTWEEFTTQNRLLPGLDPMVRISWQRCIPRLNPTHPPRWVYLSNDVFPLILHQHAALINIARPLLEDIYQSAEGLDVAFTLSDSTGCVLEVLGDPTMLDYLTTLGLRQGALLDESHLGTNAAAIAALESSGAQVVGAEHFLSYFHSLSEAAAPIFAIEGHLMGVVTIWTSADTFQPLMLAIVSAAARAIENQWQSDALTRRANSYATELNATLHAISDGVLAWNSQHIIIHINYQAGELLKLSPTRVVGRQLEEFITLPENVMRAVANAEPLQDAEAIFGVDGTEHECLVSLQVIQNGDGEQMSFIATLRQIEHIRRLVNRLVGTQAHLNLDNLPGHGRAIQKVRKQALAAANASACVLLVGEQGVGKNSLARMIHNSSPRADGPFLAMNCRAIPRELALGEFLGFEAGAFNSAISTGQQSKFELANGGTLFLSEIDALPLDTQAALLRFMESNDVIRLGGTRVIPVDVRIIAATCHDLEQANREGLFRSDLRFRLSAFLINVPSLRERSDDIPLLIESLLLKLSADRHQPLAIDNDALALLCEYPWPGNLTELESVLERAALICEDEPIQLQHLPTSVRERQSLIPGEMFTEPVRSLAEVERMAIMTAVRFTNGNLTQTAQILGIGRTTLWRKMKEAGLSTQGLH